MNNKKIITILLSAIVIYTIIGFIILPIILKSQIEKQANNFLTKKVTIDTIELNPFLLKFALNRLKVGDKEEELISFEKLYINFSLLKSIHEQHISFKEIRLSKPIINIVQKKDGSFNLLDLLKKQEKKEQKLVEENNTKPIDFKITKTVLENANVKFTPYSKTPSTIDINNFNYTFYEIGTFKNSLASHSLNTKINKDTKLFIDGGFKLIPFKMYGKIKLDNFKPKEYFYLAKDLVNFDISNTNLDIKLGYNLDLSNELKLKLSNADIRLSDFEILQDKSKALGFKEFNINNLNLSYPEQKVNISDISLSKIFANVVHDKKGFINLNALIKDSKNDNKKTTIKIEDKSAKPWLIDLKNFNIANSKASYLDEKANMKVSTSNINFKIENLNFDSKIIKLENASLSKVDLNLKSKELELKTKDFKVVANSIVSEGSNIDIKNLLLSYPDTNLFEKKSKTKIIAKNINFKINEISHKNDTFKVKNSILNKPYVNISLGKKEATKEKKEQNKKVSKKIVKKDDNNSKLKLDIGPSSIKNATLIFEDKNLPIVFKTKVSKLEGKFSELKSTSSRPTKLDLKGKVDKYGYTNITGFLEHKDIKELTDINVIFKNIAIKNFTPYSGKFVGRELRGGKLNLDLKYNIKKSNLAAQNSIIITDIELGDIIQSPDAMSLPLELGIALLEDSNGVIDLNVPISGNLDDPKFSIAPIVWKAFTNLIIKAVTSPFSFLASLLGIEGDELKTAQFSAGSFKILPFTQEKLDHLTDAMNKRPNIALSFAPTYDTRLDKYAMQEAKLEAYLDAKMKKKKSKKEDVYIDILENRFEKLYKKIDLDDVEDKFKKLDKDKKRYFDKDGYLLYIKDMLIQKEVVEIAQLEAMAKNRASSIAKYFASKKIGPKRLIIQNEVKALDTKDKKDIDVEFKIDIKK